MNDQLTPIPTSIPSHLSEALFRRYEPCILQALCGWPESTSFEVFPDLAVSTFVARFRDAIHSVQRFRWDSPIDVNLLASLHKQYTILPDPGTRVVWFRRRERQGAPVVYVQPAATRSQSSSSLNPSFIQPYTPSSSSPSLGAVPLRDITDAELVSILCLVNNNRLTGPILLTGDFSKSPLLEGYQNTSAHWDVAAGVTVIT